MIKDLIKIINYKLKFFAPPPPPENLRPYPWPENGDISRLIILNNVLI